MLISSNQLALVGAAAIAACALTLGCKQKAASSEPNSDAVVQAGESARAELSATLEAESAERRRLALRFSDSEGRPIAGVPVRARIASNSFISESGLVGFPRSDAAGLVTLDDRWWSTKRTSDEAPPELVELSAGIISREPHAVGFTNEGWPLGTVELALPPMGSMRVRVVDAHGQVDPTARGKVMVGVPEVEPPSEQDWANPRFCVEVPLVAGEALLPWVEPNTHVRLDVKLSRRSDPLTPVRVRAAFEPGATMVVDVALTQ